ncbi:hypothetical protein BC629DRAFT_1526023, partial [Irpex lacteus]
MNASAWEGIRLNCMQLLPGRLIAVMPVQANKVRDLALVEGKICIVDDLGHMHDLRWDTYDTVGRYSG